MKAWLVALCRLILIGALAQGTTALADGELLRTLIDKHLTPVSGMAPIRASDADFLRRVTLDLIGMPPTADEARAFIADPAPDKRERLIDRLFASPQHARHLAEVLDIMLMERRANTLVSQDEWQAWLLKSVRENKPWNVLAREILMADGDTDKPDQRPAARFVLDRASEPNVLTRDIGRIFFGRDMQCAQCHDHPIVGDYLQSDYHGLLAFVSPSYAMVRKDGDKQTTLQAERPGGELLFESVFVKVPRRTGPRIPDGVVIDEPFFMPGDEYQVAPTDNVKPVPKFSHRAKLAELATNGTNEAFNRNIANRLWALMFGRGLVHPLDMQHPDNPASNPELLRLLAQQLAAMNFDMRGFLREIALSEAYQRSFDPPAEVTSLATQAATEATQLEQQRAELEKAAAASAEAYSKASGAWEEAEAAMLPVAGELDTAKNQNAEAKKKVDDALKAVADVTSQLNAKQTVATPLQQAATAAQEVIKTIPDDKELAEAAQKFIAKAQLLTTELATLTKAVEEKTAVVAPATDAWNKSKPPVETALAKVTPLTAAFKQAEQAMLAVRVQSENDAETLAALDRRLATAKRVAQLPALNQALAAATEAVPGREAEFAAAQKLLADFAATVAESEAKGKSAADAVTVAANAVKAADAEHKKRVETGQAIAAAFAAADVARQKLPDDAVLADASAKLQQRATEYQAQTGESQKQLDAAIAANKAAEELFVAAQEALAPILAERSRREQAVEAAKSALAAAQADVNAKKSEIETASSDLTTRWTNDFTIASLKPLTPEQLCWAVFRVTGVYDRYWQTEVAELDKAKPLTEEQKKDLAQVAARDVELEQRTYDKLKANIPIFVGLYGAAAGQPQGDFFSTADQALFAANGGAINGWVAPAAGNVTERVINQADAAAAAEELYLGVLTRMPSDEEKTEVATYLTARAADKGAAAQELVWALLNSAEFRFNH